MDMMNTTDTNDTATTQLFTVTLLYSDDVVWKIWRVGYMEV